MLSRPQTTLLAFLSLSSFTQASWFDEALDDLVRRQDAAGSTTGDAIVPPVVDTTTTSTDVTTPTDITSTTISSTSTVPPTSTSVIITPTSSSTTTPTSSTSSSTSTTETSSSSSSSTTTEQPPTSTSTTEVKTTAPPTSASTTVIRVTHTKTVDGQVLTSVSESTSLIQPTSTNPASLNQSNETSGSGMSAKTRTTIIGVVVGLGGAVLLGGLAVVAYRIWGRKKSRQQGDDFDGYSRPDTGMEKAGGSSGGSSGNPFQSTLESYHQPGKVNASSNF